MDVIWIDPFTTIIKLYSKSRKIFSVILFAGVIIVFIMNNNNVD